MKKNLSIILSLIALVGVVVLAVVMACLNVSLSNVSLDTFIGVMVTMIGILVTFAVGWQVINALEIKSKLAEIEKIKADVKQQEAIVQENYHRVQHLIALSWAEDAYNNEEYAEAYRYSLHSLLSSMSLRGPINIDKVLKVMKHAAKEIPESFTIDAEFYDLVIADDAQIRTLNGYQYVKSVHEQSFAQYTRKVVRKQNHRR